MQEAAKSRAEEEGAVHEKECVQLKVHFAKNAEIIDHLLPFFQ